MVNICKMQQYWLLQDLKNDRIYFVCDEIQYDNTISVSITIKLDMTKSEI